jgi:glycosidase
MAMARSEAIVARIAPARLALLVCGLTAGSAALADAAPVPVKGQPDVRLQADGHVDEWLTHTDGHPEAIPAKGIGNEVMYQIFVDRFADGNPANDCLDDGRFCDPMKQDWFRFWGGDLRGVVDHLPYLKDLGITRLWLTPIFDNQLVKVARVRHGRPAQITAYHGYWIRDWFQLNPYFTDAGKRDYALVDELIERAQPEIRVLLDTVANHTNPADATPESLAYVTDREPLPNGDGHARTQRGALFRDGEYVTSVDEDLQSTGVRNYHRNGSITNWDDSYQVENFQVDGLADLDQSSPVVQDYMRAAHAWWLERFPGLAGYRMDTIKHVPQSYWRQFDQDLFGAFPAAEVVGEYFGAGPGGQAGAVPFYKQTHMTMFDFQFRYTVERVFLQSQPISQFVRLWEKDPQLVDARGLVTFVDNHDISRLRGMGMSERSMRQAIGLLFTGRGIPCVYYGLEQDLFYPGDPGDPFNRPMMTSFDETAPLYREIRRLARLRKVNPALRYGHTHVVHETDQILAYERVLDDQRVFFATSKNPIAGSDRFEMQSLSLPDGVYQDVLTDREYTVRGGHVPVDLHDGDMIVLSSTAVRPLTAP